MSREYAVSLTTAIKPAAKVLLDGEEFSMLGPEHLSPAEDAETMALFARHSILATELELCKNITRGKDLAEQVRTTRFQIIAQLTTIPREKAERLPLAQQAKLMDAIRRELEEDDEQEEREDATTSSSCGPDA